MDHGGYCFLNNAAIASQRLRDDGAVRVAVLDVDDHHGNGTQSTFHPHVVVTSLGVDTFERDPISHFRLERNDSLRVGTRIVQLERPTPFVFEGGYAVDAIGVNVVNVLAGLDGAS